MEFCCWEFCWDDVRCDVIFFSEVKLEFPAADDDDDDDVIGVNWGNEGVLKLIPDERLLARLLVLLKGKFFLGDKRELLLLLFVELFKLFKGSGDVILMYFLGFSRETNDPEVPSRMVGYDVITFVDCC